MGKICLIRQPAGIGDIFFTQKIADTYIKKGFKVIWPVIPEFTYLNDYIKTDGLVFVNENDDFPLKEYYLSNHTLPYEISENEIYIPIQHFDGHYNGSVMHAKYGVLGIDFSDWVDYFNFNRNLEREQKILDHYNIKNNEFTVVNRLYGSPPNSLVCDKIGKFDNSIEMEYLGWDNLFDWVGLLLKAKSIHTVETSLVYIISKLKLDNTVVYSKPNFNSFFHVKDIHNKNIKLVK